MNTQIRDILEGTQVLYTTHSTIGLQAYTTFSWVKICPWHIIKGCYIDLHPLKCKSIMIMGTYWRHQTAQVLIRERYRSMNRTVVFYSMAPPRSGPGPSLPTIHDHTQTHQCRYDSSGREISPTRIPLTDNTQAFMPLGLAATALRCTILTVELELKRSHLTS